jgi:YfiH family protein
LNLGLSTGDLLEHVQENRARLTALCQAPLAWVEQVHGNTVVDAMHALTALKSGQARLKADASVTDAREVACVVMVADCLPVLLADSAGRAVGAAHAGWRGLLAGVIENTAAAIAQRVGPEAQLHAFLGPAIGPHAFEVGAEVRAAFLQAALPAEFPATERAFVAHPAHVDKFFCNLYALARLRLARVGVTSVTGGDHCTVSEPERFYSFRRARVTGRCAALIWRI